MISRQYRSLIFLVSFLCGTISIAHAQLLAVGMPAPKIRVSKWIKGEPILALNANNIYVLEFWATWCESCKHSIPFLSSLAKKYKGKITVIGINVAEANTADVEPFVKSLGEGIDFHVAIDDQQSPTARRGFMSDRWMAAAGQRGIPLTFVVGKSGKIEYIGPPTELEPVISNLIAGKWNAQEYAAARDKAQKQEETKRREELETWRSSPLGLLASKIDVLVKAKKFKEALASLDKMESMHGQGRIPNPKAWSSGIKMSLYETLGDMDGYYRSAETFFEILDADAQEPLKTIKMNKMLAWPIVDPESTLSRKDYNFALKVAKRMVEIDNRKNSPRLDTLAWALYWTGNREAAIETEAEALRIAIAEKDKENIKAFIETLYKFQKTP